MSSAVRYTYQEPIIEPPDGDPIARLPVDNNPPTNNEIQIIDTLFKKHRGTMDIIFEESKESFCVAFLVIILSLPQIDDIIKKFLPIAVTSSYILILIKGILAMSLFWIVKHFYLSRRC